MRPGRTAHYRNMTALPVPADLPIPTCGRCFDEYLDEEAAPTIQAALAAAYTGELRRRVRQAIDALMKVISQRKLELLLGLSQGYLSRLRAGLSNPSPELVSHLALIACDPKPRLSELHRYWGGPGSLPTNQE